MGIIMKRVFRESCKSLLMDLKFGSGNGISSFTVHWW